MATVEDRWWRTITHPDGTAEKVKTDRHGKGKRWLLRYRDPDGQPKKLSFAKQVHAHTKRKEIEADLLRGTYLDAQAGKETFGAYATRWAAALNCDPLTRENITGRLRRYVEPHSLYRTPLRGIRPSTVQAWLRSLDERGLAPSTIRVVFSHVSAALAAAVDDDVLAKNPCRPSSVRPPRVTDHKVVPWAREWVAGMRGELPDRYGIAVTLGAGLGLRQGEMFGLSPDDVDWLRGWVTVQRQVKIVGSKLVLAPPKGDKTRHVPLPAVARDDMAAHLARWPSRSVTLPWGTPDGEHVTVPLLVTSRESRALNRNHFNQEIWKPALGRVGIPAGRENGCHALRHYYASVLLDAGESIRAVAEYLGHSSPGFTLKTYTHLMPSSEDRTKAAVDADLGSIARAPSVPHDAKTAP